MRLTKPETRRPGLSPFTSIVEVEDWDEGLLMLSYYGPDNDISDYEWEAVFDTPENAEQALKRLRVEHPEIVDKVFVGAEGEVVHDPKEV